MRLSYLLVALLPFALGACEIAPKTSSQNGYRGTGMNHIEVNGSSDVAEVPAPPYELPPAGALTAGEAYENVQVLADVSDKEFTYLMAAITEWVSPEEGCNYCHNPANLASDEVYTKVVARKMIQMTQALNSGWGSHVGETGVTCWTCHRGNNIPEEYWSEMPAPKSKGFAGVKDYDNTPTANTVYASLPGNYADLFLAHGDNLGNISIASKTVYPSEANTRKTPDAEPTYALMNHMSDALGVNCTFCHNTQAFNEWSLSTPQRATAWHGLRMVGDINANYITPLADVFPANRLGSEGDPFKTNCTTCHQGLNKPMGGFPMVKDYPALRLMPSEVAAETMAEAVAELGDAGDGG